MSSTEKALPVNPGVIILDTTCFLQGVSFSRKDIRVAAPEDVVNEVRSRIPKLRLEQMLSSGTVQICGATKEAVNAARQAAEKTGDLPNLSKPDIAVIALAMEQKKVNILPIVYTGDYAVQNVLKSQGIAFRSVANDGIKAMIKWVYKCDACKATFKAPPEGNVCPECGTENHIVRQKKY
ncbi:MAG: NOB1 family endonuclease [Candidatus Lokiarchaeota archaeon]|nr:NOB1 family endonuclease [Candidatus Lokiarchaeota archaeon]